MLSFNPRRLHRDSMVFFEHAGSVKNGIVIMNDPFVFQCTVRLVDKPQDTTGKGPSGSGSLVVKYSDLRNESQGKSRKRSGKFLRYEFIKIKRLRMLRNLDPNKNAQRPKPKKNIQGGKPQEDILRSLDYFELPEKDITSKFSPCIKCVKKANLSCN